LTQQHQASGEDGFSLVEVLVGLMLTSVLVAALALLGAQFKAYLDANDRLEQLLELHAVARKIAEVIEQAEALPVQRNNREQDLFLSGQPDSVAFVATLKLGVDVSGLRDVEIVSDLHRGLVMKTRYHRPGKPDNAEPVLKTYDMMNGDASVQFQYDDLGADRDAPSWADKWDHPARLPRGIQIVVTRKTRDGEVLSASAFAALWAQ
jgi:prepilin-type N-terminal cleavage/methylation domain-containing protein